MSNENLITVSEAAKLKGVAPRTIYGAIWAGRLPHKRVLNRVALREEDVLRYEPTRYGKRAGAKGRGGRPKGTPMSQEAKLKISNTQKHRWQNRKQKS